MTRNYVSSKLLDFYANLLLASFSRRVHFGNLACKRLRSGLPHFDRLAYIYQIYMLYGSRTRRKLVCLLATIDSLFNFLKNIRIAFLQLTRTDTNTK